MPSMPRLMPTQATAETYGGVTYHIDGELVPVLSVDVSEQSVYFEHHILLWKNPEVRIGLKAMKGMLKRMMAGMQRRAAPGSSRSAVTAQAISCPST